MGIKWNFWGLWKTRKKSPQLYRVDRYGTPNIANNLRHKIAIFASLNPHISGGDQPTLTKFGKWVEPLRLHFRTKARRDRANQFGAIDDEPIRRRRKMAIFASFNPHISGGGQPTPTQFGTLVEPQGLHFRAQARRDRSNHFRAIGDEVRGKCAKIGTPRRVWRPLAPKLWPRPPFLFYLSAKGTYP